MYDLVHRYAPASPVGRTLVAIIASVIGVPTLVLGLLGLADNAAAGLLFLLMGVVTLTVAGQLTRGVVRQAASAGPEASPHETGTPDESDERPVETLRRRYAAGEISDDEFERRLDRLLETERQSRSADERERLVE
ncbi:SHOCT domain-containing protein [Natrinema altunense]|uniref:SHOCT domain-containing protein n=1 Tax=Natrinema altunense (strain JCM 12890 / CGMCC 1.3731 / AJ2) TaxID=1227494 RepID=L9ZLK3_NATA2|nr:SHOCT domain-containing protein [Natrinema altunense]ELY86023.1 hypothetical protein C485_12498 [Natrinema altunense JCM 12890]